MLCCIWFDYIFLIFSDNPAKKKKKQAEKILPQKVRDLVPESQAYMDLLAFERKLDATIMRKRLDIQEALKRPMKQKRKLRIFISNTFYPPKEPTESEEGTVASWELRVEGRLLDDSKNEPNKVCMQVHEIFNFLNMNSNNCQHQYFLTLSCIIFEGKEEILVFL